MGVDILSDSGVVVSVDELSTIVTDDNKELACRTLLRYTLKLFRQGKHSLYDLMVSKFAGLGIDSSHAEIRKMLISLSPGIEDGLDSHIENGDEALEVWRELISVLFPDAPLPKSTEFGWSSRYQGDDLPSGVLFVFSERDCFTRDKTPVGKALDTMLQRKTSVTTWTTYSV